MWRLIGENARTMRAVLAVCAAVALGFVLLAQEHSRAEAKQRAIYVLNSALWKMSELVVESQRLALDLSEYRAGRRSKEAVALRFEILWSRIDVLHDETRHGDATFAGELARIDAFLRMHEAAFTGPAPIPGQLVEEWQADLESMMLGIRRAWVEGFVADTTVMTRLADSAAAGMRSYSTLVALLIAALLLYVLAEVFFAGRATRRERALREEAAQASAAKSRFLANVSHEIRTPLNGILGMASELAESALTEDQAQCLRVIEQSGGVLLSTINDVLDLSKVEAGQFHVELRPFDLRAVLEAACALYAARAREKGLALELSVREDLPVVVLGDGRRLRQVLHNLIANAVKFTETGGITVRALPSQDAAGIVISVRDTGPGISVEARERIFQPFMQEDSSITRRFGGTGLGLAISRQLCEAMGGTLTVVSRPEKGATFYCELPLEAAPADSMSVVEAEQAAPPDLSGRHILVADDNDTNRLILQRFLVPTRATLRFARNGAEAVEQAAETRFDIILMDIQMPRLDGVAAAIAIRSSEAERGLPRVPIIAVTANALHHQTEEYRSAGMDEVLAKPVSKRALMALLRRFPPQAEAA